MSDKIPTWTVLRPWPWLTMFVIVKCMGTALANWSWWWLLLPSAPGVWLILHHFGML